MHENEWNFEDDEKRLADLGRFLRRFSFDEWPQLWNVRRGEMSLIGPRPLLVVYLDRYTDRQARRHDVLPGITGWSQIKGRNTASWTQRLDLDVWYLDNRSFWLDLKILLLTTTMPFTARDISPKTEFMGSLKMTLVTDAQRPRNVV